MIPSDLILVALNCSIVKCDKETRVETDGDGWVSDQETGNNVSEERCKFKGQNKKKYQSVIN